ncbi:MAG TPA: hypothetical protein G4O03_01580 [Dehalococcoidia bacterium]|jgi:hypothetical protein|nr:hypothetical protein [Dehalococcoidia bacterium]
MIDDYQFGQIVVAGAKYTSDIIILPQRVIPGWRRREGHILSPEDLMEVVQDRPDLLIVGTGSSGLVKVTPEARQHLEANNIELIVQDTPAACQTYNRLCGAKKVAAALHLTC